MQKKIILQNEITDKAEHFVEKMQKQMYQNLAQNSGSPKYDFLWFLPDKFWRKNIFTTQNRRKRKIVIC